MFSNNHRQRSTKSFLHHFYSIAWYKTKEQTPKHQIENPQKGRSRTTRTRKKNRIRSQAKIKNRPRLNVEHQFNNFRIKWNFILNYYDYIECVVVATKSIFYFSFIVSCAHHNSSLCVCVHSCVRAVTSAVGIPFLWVSLVMASKNRINEHLSNVSQFGLSISNVSFMKILSKFSFSFLKKTVKKFFNQEMEYST